MQDMYFWTSITIFVLTFIGILSEKVHRSLIAFAGALSMVIIGNKMGFYSFEQVGDSINYSTLLLLAGMMTLVAVIEKTGFFEYVAIRIAQKTHGSYWKLLISLGVATAILSMFLDNVTTVVLMAPVTLTITRILHFNPIPLLMSQAIVGNIGGVGTLVGDPPNIIIGSSVPLSFSDFLTHSLPVVIVAFISVVGYLLFISRNDNKTKPKYREKLMELHAKKSIIKPKVLKKSLLILGMVIILFFLHHHIGLLPAEVALLGAISILLLVAPHDNPQKYLKKLELSIFVFFSSLFVLVGGLEAAGVLEFIANKLISGVNDNILLTAIIIMWASAFLSSVIDNIPMTIAMVPVIGYFEAQGVPGSHMLRWALVFGVGFGGNITPVGSTSNVIVMNKLELAGHKIHTSDWMKVGIPVTVIALSIASGALITFGEYFM